MRGEIATETVAGCALGGGEGLGQGIAIKVLCVDADDGAEDVGAAIKHH